MSDSTSAIDERIALFRRNVAATLVAKDDFIDWNAIDNEMSRNSDSIKYIQEFADSGDHSALNLSNLLHAHPSAYGQLLTLIAFNSSGAQVERWGLPAVTPNEPGARLRLSELLIYIGLQRLFLGACDVASMSRVAEVYRDSVRRRFRSSNKLQSQLSVLVRQSIQNVSPRIPGLQVGTANALSGPDSRSLEFVLSRDGRPFAGIATVFQNQSGGRQQRDLTFTYPLLQERLASRGISLILIADGAGFLEASDRSLRTLFNAVQFTMTFAQAIAGELELAIAEAATGEVRSIDRAAIDRLITAALESDFAALASKLPTELEEAVLALARYAETHVELDLVLSSDGSQLAWRRPGLISEARSLRSSYENTRAISLLSNVLGLGVPRTATTEAGDITATLDVGEAPPFNGQVHVTGTGRDPLEVVRQVGIRSMESAPGAPVALLLAHRQLDPRQVDDHRRRQSVQPVNVIVVGADDLLRLASTRNPLTSLIDTILLQSDLTKISPFVLSNATPQRMFYGREGEAATVLGTISSNSVAILGSRRIGKTSLLRRVQADLTEANYAVYFADCQTVRTWSDFATTIQPKWQIDVPEEFKPSHLRQIVESLRTRSLSQVVILLDEIDQLLVWDAAHTEDVVPEAFFRACRSISQEGLAQFVFSGERSIANKLSDPHSPHWNFTRPIPLRQLERDAATQLLMNPLKSLNIQISDQSKFAAEAWRRTSGHPQIIQYLGDRLVRRLDFRTDRTRLALSTDDLLSLTETFEYADHYIETYWGQATTYEKALSRLISSTPLSISQLIPLLQIEHPATDERQVLDALRILQLYGIVEEVAGAFFLKAEWFGEALRHFGGDHEPTTVGATT